MPEIWLYGSLQDVSTENSAGEVGKRTPIETGSTHEEECDGAQGPPVLVAEPNAIPEGYPILEGRHRQQLPRLEGHGTSCLQPAGRASGADTRHIEAWLIPWRPGPEQKMIITIRPGTVLAVDVRAWPKPDEEKGDGRLRRRRDRLLRRAGRFLEQVEGAFTIAGSIDEAYDRLECLWKDRRLEEGDPIGELLDDHAKTLRRTMEDLRRRPRAILRTRHEHLKMGAVRRTTAKTLRWLSSQPGRTTAERAGAKQRIFAPKRRETIATPENEVLRAFAELTLREAKAWIEKHPGGERRTRIEAHGMRAKRLATMLRTHGVAEARAPVIPNFPLRFDPRYHEIWIAWNELRRRARAKERDWMWQTRTWMELAGVRAAMHLRQRVRTERGGGILRRDGTIGPVMEGRGAVRWDELSAERPEALRSIPDLYIYEADINGWKALEPLLHQVIQLAGASSQARRKLRDAIYDAIYKATQASWKNNTYPLGSDGEPPKSVGDAAYKAAKRLLRDAVAIMQADLEGYVARPTNAKPKEVNRLHMPLTWLFTACPTAVVGLLPRAAADPAGKEGEALCMGNDFSAWAVYSGIGRAAHSKESFRTIFDTLIGQWEARGGQAQDKFLLAAVTHAMARRVEVRHVLNEDRERFDRAKRYLLVQLRNVIRGIHDGRPDGKRPRLEVRYITMGYRGLCQIRYAHPTWCPWNGEEAREVYETLPKIEGRTRSKWSGHDGNKDMVGSLVKNTAPYLIGEGTNPTMPGGL